MIGGTDVVISTSRGTEALDLAVRAVKRFWPSALLEDAVTGEMIGDYRQINTAGHHEILAFRDAESAALWDEIGADPSLDGTLIHFLLSDGELTIAIDANPPAAIRAFVEDLKKDLKKEHQPSHHEAPS